MQLRVTKYGEPILKERGESVSEFTDELRQLASDMLETMHAHEGIGLAAQQVGRALQLFVADMRITEKCDQDNWIFDGSVGAPMDIFMPLIAVNPKIMTSGELNTYEEGCLSFPGIRGEVERPFEVVMDYQDAFGNPHRIKADGLFAKVIQHEYDHCQGVLFTDRMNPRTLFSLQSRIKRLKRQSRDWIKANLSQQ